MDSATISAVAALAGATIGGVASFGTSPGTEKREKLTAQFDATKRLGELATLELDVDKLPHRASTA